MCKIQNDIFWMNQAIKLAKIAEKKGEIPVGAVLIYKNKILAKTWNQSIFYHDPSAHAEILALRIGGRKIKNYRINHSTLYVTLEPCIMCFGALIHARIFRLVFGTNNIKSGAIGKNISIFKYCNFNHNIVISGGVLYRKCRKILSSFFRKKRLVIKN